MSPNNAIALSLKTHLSGVSSKFIAATYRLPHSAIIDEAIRLHRKGLLRAIATDDFLTLYEGTASSLANANNC
jgi:hypothetical protein